MEQQNDLNKQLEEMLIKFVDTKKKELDIPEDRIKIQNDIERVQEN